jgi:hypothetical protein
MMAIIMRGKTSCSICGQVINDADDIVAFSPFMANDADPLSVFNDAAYHAECFAVHPLAQRCRSVYDDTRTRLGPGQRICCVCGEEIDNVDEYFTFGCLTSDDDSAFHKFNWVQLHRSCITSWRSFDDITTLLDEGLHSGELKGAAIENIMSEMKTFAARE